MTDFYIFRHGDTVNTDKPQIIHKEDTHKLHILPKGAATLKKIGNFLKNVSVDENFCSPYLRCRQSADIVAQITDDEYRLDNRISELEGEEKFSDFKERVIDFLSEIERN